MLLMKAVMYMLWSLGCGSLLSDCGCEQERYTFAGEWCGIKPLRRGTRVAAKLSSERTQSHVEESEPQKEDPMQGAA